MRKEKKFKLLWPKETSGQKTEYARMLAAGRIDTTARKLSPWIMAARRGKKTTKGYDDSIRIRLEGSRDTGEILAMFREAIHKLRYDCGIKRFRAINIYVTPIDENGHVLTKFRNGKPSPLVIAEPYRSAAEDHGL